MTWNIIIHCLCIVLDDYKRYLTLCHGCQVQRKRDFQQIHRVFWLLKKRRRMRKLYYSR
jgi:hypothetical protein